MNDNEVIEFLKSDMVWHKPTQVLVHQIIFSKFYGIIHLEMTLKI